MVAIVLYTHMKRGYPKDAIWNAVLGEIELSVSRGSYVTWFKSTSLLQREDGSYVVRVPNIFIKQQLESRFIDMIRDSLAKNGADVSSLHFEVGAVSKTNKKIDDEPILATPRSSKAANKHRSALSHSYRQGLNVRYTFDSFIVGGANELAYAACQAIAHDPGNKYNPLFLYGGVGIGKTHLIQAVGNHVLANNKDARVIYVSTEQFVQEFLDAIRYKKNTDFAGHYRGADVLIIDDIQFIAGKEKTQEEFFHTFNALHQANKQIIISSDKPPRDIPTLEERLRSRFAWGMSIDMQTPDFETRCAILQTKAVARGFHLDAEVVEYLAQGVRSNIRELEGTLNQLLALCEMKQVDPDIVLAKSLLSGTKNRPRHVSPKHIIERTAKFFHISTNDILGPKRDKDIVVPRQVAMYMLRNELHLSFPKIAKELGRKDHTTAIHSVEKIEREQHEDQTIRDALSQIKERLYA